MGKQEAMIKVNTHLKKSVLNINNTHSSNINRSKNVWWFNIPPKKFSNDLHLLLLKKTSFLWLKINAGLFSNPDKIFKLRTDINKIDLEISSEETNNYLVDIKSGGTSYDFNVHLEHEFS